MRIRLSVEQDENDGSYDRELLVQKITQLIDDQLETWKSEEKHEKDKTTIVLWEGQIRYE